MPAILEKVEVRTFDRADEVRTFGNGRAEILRIGETEVTRFVLEPGYRWSTHLKPLAGTGSCRSEHLGYQLSGTLGIRMDDGSERVSHAGNVVSLPAGHDVWVVGDEAVVIVDFRGAEEGGG